MQAIPKEASRIGQRVDFVRLLDNTGVIIINSVHVDTPQPWKSRVLSPTRSLATNMAQPTFPAHPGDTAFEESYERFEEYPTNLVHGAAYNPTLLRAYYSRLTSIDQSSSLFSKRMVSFIVWDYNIDTQSEAKLGSNCAGFVELIKDLGFVFKKIESDAYL